VAQTVVDATSGPGRRPVAKAVPPPGDPTPPEEADIATAADVDRQVMARMAQANAELLVRVLRGEETVAGDPAMVALAAARSLGVVVDDILRGLVVRARADGRTWAEIGEVLHVTRQAALQRFGGPHPDPETPEEAPVRPLPGAAALAIVLLDHFLNRRWDELRAHFDQRMLDACSVVLLTSVRARLPLVVETAPGGADPRVTQLGEHTVVDVPLSFKRGFKRVQVSGRVVFDDFARVAGFFILAQSPPGL
jgi:hypothetical protein